jgi:glutamyl-Q tRNA(Asp) synthetase
MIRTRFAPAPTGFLHLGHVVNAIYVWSVARPSTGSGQGGEVLLRIEDHDRQRSRPEFERAILDDLDWLGFVPNSPSTDDFRAGRCEGRQSDRLPVYESALEDLRRKGLVYACECTRSDLGPSDGTGERRYPGTCAEKGLLDGPGLGLRVRLEHTVETFVDRAHGPQAQQPAEQCGDLLIRDRDGNWTYQFAAVVDDVTQGITLVVRGDDLLPSTGRQIQLARLLGRAEPPEFLHHPLVMKSATQKLSKADGDTGIRELRARGWSPAEVIAHAQELSRRHEEHEAR